ncbi:MAG: substrate-binding domain-containing protein [Phycisphaerae bacterium]
MRDKDTIRIAVLLARKQLQLHRSLPGLHRFSREHPEVQFLSIHEEVGLDDLLAEGQIDGILGHREVQHLPTLEAWGGPMVSILWGVGDGPMVIHDHGAIGRMAGSFLVERGFEDIGYTGDPSAAWSGMRRAGLQETALSAGRRVHLLQDQPGMGPEVYASRSGYIDAMVRWLGNQTFPFGLFCGLDSIGEFALEACVELGLRVPDDVAILAATGDEWFSRFCDPPLTTVNTNLPEMAYEAAHWLLEIIQGRSTTSENLRVVPPIGITERASTDVFPYDDRAVARAMRFARDHLSDSIGVDDLAAEAKVSASTLHRRFVAATGLAPGAMLRRLRIDRARHRLVETDDSLLQIALECGFGGAAQFSREFRKAVGTSPSQFRSDSLSP